MSSKIILSLDVNDSKLLDTCMRRCGPLFMSEVGKFRFLNEMIKLVSPKYLGNSTSISVREKVLTLLREWTTNYPHEPKIKEAYEMLKKQGLVKNDCSPITSSSEKISQPFRIKNPVFDDEEKSRILQKLLQSKNPDDLLAANKLIKSMVKEDERRAQRDSRRMMELESVHNNVKLLSDMLDSYLPAQTSTEDIELMKELYETCERLQPTIERLAQETLDNEIVLAEVVGASDDLEKVREKYIKILLYNQPSNSLNVSMKTRDELLDLSSSSLTVSPHSEALNNEKDFNLPTHSQSNIELLGEIFGPSCNTTEIHLSDQPLLLSNPLVVQSTNNSNSNNDGNYKELQLSKYKPQLLNIIIRMKSKLVLVI